MPDFVIEREWGGRQARERRYAHLPVPPPRREEPTPVARMAGGHSDGEFLWRQAVEKHTGVAGALSQNIPWEAVCTHSLAEYFIGVLGDEGRDRPLLVSDRVVQRPSL